MDSITRQRIMRARLTTRLVKAWRRRLLARYKVLKGCSRCGWKEHAAALDFHHHGRKTFNISTALTNRWGSVKKEIFHSCVILCANCHRIVEAQIRKES